VIAVEATELIARGAAELIAEVGGQTDRSD